jgi:hypothetical protein
MGPRLYLHVDFLAATKCIDESTDRLRRSAKEKQQGTLATLRGRGAGECDHLRKQRARAKSLDDHLAQDRTLGPRVSTATANDGHRVATPAHQSSFHSYK